MNQIVTAFINIANRSPRRKSKKFLKQTGGKMNDRFKFRIYIKAIAREGEVDKGGNSLEIPYGLLIYNACIYGDGDVGYGIDDLDDALDCELNAGRLNKEQCDIIRYDIRESCGTTESCGEWLMAQGEVVYKEQCAGLKDKNGDLIYEGDVLFSHRDKKQGVVIFDELCACFCVRDEDGDHLLNMINFIPKESRQLEHSEIIGNIHEKRRIKMQGGDKLPSFYRIRKSQNSHYVIHSDWYDNVLELENLGNWERYELHDEFLRMALIIEELYPQVKGKCKIANPNSEIVDSDIEIIRHKHIHENGEAKND
jgi:hypothetical protein